MSALRPPRARPAAALGGVVLALLLIAAAVLAVHDTAVARHWISDPSWTYSTLDWADGRTADALSTTVGVVAVLLGLVFLVVALKPARRTHESAGVEDIDFWVSPAALEALAVNAAERTPAVSDVRARAGRKRIVVRVRTSAAGVGEQVRDQVAEVLTGLTRKPVVIRAEAQGAASDDT